MEKVTSSTTSQMSATVTWIGIGGALGGILTGPFLDRFDGLLVIVGSTLFQGISVGLASFFHLIGYQVLAGLTMAFNYGLTTGKISN